MDLKKVKILVTGADGFIGSHLVERLAKDYRVKAFVYYNSFNSWGWLDNVPENTRKKIEVVTGDIRDFNSVKKAMEGCEVVFHLAALIAIPYSYIAPQSYVDTNITGTLNVLQAARELKVKRIVHTSTSETYGTALYVPIDEKHPLQGQSPYSATKIGADQLALSFFRSFDLPVTVIRPFNTYGPRQSARAIIPTVITQIAAGEKELKLGAINPTTDLNFVQDTVTGFIKLAGCDKAVGEVVNIGSGSEISIGELVKKIAGLMKAKIRIVTEQQRIRPEKSEVMRLCADISRAKTLLKYSPEYSLDKGLQETIKWFREKKNLGFYKTDIYNV
jgi:NAD dependent epimerase/dehydratase